MPQFEISTFSSQLFWFFVCWGIVFVYLWKFLVPRMSAKLSERERKIHSILEEATRFDHQAGMMILQYDDKLKHLKQMQKAKLQQTTEFVQKSKENLEFDLKQELDAQLLKLEANLKKSQEKMLKSLPTELEGVLTEFAQHQVPFTMDGQGINTLINVAAKRLKHHD
jgi:F-type H+-transporting ATPase subunit b